MANLGRVTGTVYVVPTTSSVDAPVELSAHDREVMESGSTVVAEAPEKVEATKELAKN